MITTGSKWYIGLGVVSLVLAVAYGWTTGGNGLGPLTMGYKGGVGDHFGYGLLMATAGISLFLGFVTLAVRDAEAEAVAEVAGTDRVPPVKPVPTSWWPPVTAFGVALVVIGLVAQPVLVAFGLLALGIVLVEWMVQTWAEHATGDPEVNRRIRNRVMAPIEFPVAGFLAIAVVVLAFSRIFLALSAEATVWVAAALSAVILLLVALVASRPKISRNLIVGLVLGAAVVVIGLGVAAVVAGEREFHPAVEEDSGSALAGTPTAGATIEVVG